MDPDPEPRSSKCPASLEPRKSEFYWIYHLDHNARKIVKVLYTVEKIQFKYKHSSTVHAE
jgi:hypothetical protein